MPVNNVVMDLSDMFPEASPEKTTTLFDSEPSVTDISSLDKDLKEEKVTPEAAPLVAVKAEPTSGSIIPSGPIDMEDLISTEQFEQRIMMVGMQVIPRDLEADPPTSEPELRHERRECHDRVFGDAAAPADDAHRERVGF